MASYDAHVGDSGTTLTKTLHVAGAALGDLSGASFVVRATNQSGVVESWDLNAASLGAPGFWGMSGGRVQFVTPSTSYWDERGTWTWDVQYTLGGVTQTADPITLQVGPSGAAGYVAPDIARRYVVIGDSISSDPFATDLTIATWARRLATRLRGADPYSYVYARGVASRAFTDWTTALLYAAVRAHDATDALVYLGINDLLNGGDMDFVSLSTRAETVWDDLTDMGVRVHAMTIAPGGCTGVDEATRQSFNVWLLNGQSASDLTTITDIDLALRDPANLDALLAAYDSGDGVHPNNAGHIVFGNAVADALELP